MTQAYAWGLNADGQCGSEPSPVVRVPHRISLPSSAGDPVEIRCGAHFTAILDTHGSLFTLGSSKDNRKGWTNNSSNSNTNGKSSHAARRIDMPSPVVSFDCGLTHGIAVTSDSKIFCWGKFGLDRGKSSAHDGTPVEVIGNGEAMLSGAKPIKVFAGDRISLLITDDGSLWKLGARENPVERVPLPEGYRCIDASVGPVHAACIASEGTSDISGDGDSSSRRKMGKLFTWRFCSTGKSSGCTDDGELGRPSKGQSWSVPGPVGDRDDFVSVAVSKGGHHRHTAATLADGTAVSFGSGYKGKLGHGANAGDSDSATPKEVVFTEDSSVKNILAGGIHAGLISDRGDLYTWGCGSDGRLGFPEHEGSRYLYRENSPRMVIYSYGKGKGKNNASDNDKTKTTEARVVSASLGYYHSAAVIAQ